jgi:RimJ/RimL family protein N-acetyltransferase
VEQGLSFVLETARLRLREFTLTDVDAMKAILGDAETMQYYPTLFPRPEIEEWIRRNLARYRDCGFGVWAMLVKGSDEVIGDCGCYVREVEGDFEFELAWHVRRDLWNRGYATEAAERCIEYAFSMLGAQRIIALVRPENKSSCRVAEKSGMTCERVFFWHGYDHCIYAKQKN